MIINLPSFFLIGPESQSQHSLYKKLQAQPELFLAPSQEAYFSSDNNYQKGIAFYYKRFQDAQIQQLKGEFAPEYFHYPEKVIKRMRYLYNGDFQDLKFVVLLENPYKRLLKSFLTNIDNEIECSGLEKAIRREKELLENSSFIQHGFNLGLYQSASCYSSRLEPWLKKLNSDQILLLKEEEMDQNFQVLARFLGLSCFKGKEIVTEQRNRVNDEYDYFWMNHLDKLPTSCIEAIDSELKNLGEMLKMDFSSWFFPQNVIA